MVEKYTAGFSNQQRDTIQDALATMRKASVLVRELETYFAGYNLSQLRFLILIVIDREPERTNLSPHEIAQRLDVSRPVLTRTLKKLVDEGLLLSTDDTVDKRSKHLSLTKDGSTLLAALMPGYFATIDRVMGK